MNIDFYNSKAFKIDSPELKEKIFLKCEQILQTVLKRDYFPGAQPVTIEKKDLMKLKQNYMVCEKSDGERGVLILINIDSKPMCFMINRNNEIYFMDFFFKKEVFEGSIFDGEIIETKKTKKWNYLMHDCLAYNGKSFMNESHNLRYACIIDFITRRYSHRELDCLYMKTKLFYNYGSEIEKTWTHIKKTTENEIDGLIFTPINEPIRFGRDYSLFKWKETHTIDLLAKIKQKGNKINGNNGNNGIELFYIKKSNNILFKTFQTDSINYNNIITFFKEIEEDLKQLIKGVIIEFKYSINDEIFIPYRIRFDKDKPNGEITVNNTIKNIQEDIKIKELNNLLNELSI